MKVNSPCNNRCVVYAMCINKIPETKIKECDKFRDYIRPLLTADEASNMRPEIFNLIYDGYDEEADAMMARVLKDPTIGTIEYKGQRIQININYIAERFKK